MEFGVTVCLLRKRNEICLLGERNEKKAGLDKGRENVMQANKALANLAPDLPCVGQKWPGLYTSTSHSHQIQDACGKS